MLRCSLRTTLLKMRRINRHYILRILCMSSFFYSTSNCARLWASSCRNSIPLRQRLGEPTPSISPTVIWHLQIGCKIARKKCFGTANTIVFGQLCCTLTTSKALHFIYAKLYISWYLQVLLFVCYIAHICLLQHTKTAPSTKLMTNIHILPEILPSKQLLWLLL